jgi:hypothetical protein
MLVDHFIKNMKTIGACVGGVIVGVMATLNLRAGSEVLEVGQNYRVVKTTWISADAEGEPIVKEGRYTELEAGCHYWKDGDWVESRELIESFPQGAIARQGCYQVVFNWNVHAPGSIDMQLPDGQRMRGHPLGISWTDTASGATVWVAKIQDAEGEILPPNRIVYRDAFDGLKADMCYTYGKGSFEADVILREIPALPAGWSKENARLEMRTEFLDCPELRVIDRGNWRALPARMGDGSSIVLTDPASPAKTRFYRVRLE